MGARIVRKRGRPDLAFHPEQLARRSRSSNAGGNSRGRPDMTSTTEAPTFLLTPRQHLQWAERARRHNRPDLAQQHEQLARAIERIEKRRQAEHNADRVPPLR
jgi:hypothetical protein